MQGNRPRCGHKNDNHSTFLLVPGRGKQKPGQTPARRGGSVMSLTHSSSPLKGDEHLITPPPRQGSEEMKGKWRRRQLR
ncbi:hypothetical protein J6590_018069 [Homalodisca vitripennis]|nr:hypothetical protein J6590_018069 [Homalodisca vitripennis]